MAAQSQGLFLYTIAHERPRRRARQIRQLDCSPRERRQRQAPRLPVRALQPNFRVPHTTQPVIDIHIHIMPFHMMKPHALALIKHGRKDYADVERYCSDPKAFLKLLDQLGIERAGLINYVAPDIIGFTPEVNDWSAKYCKAAPDRLIAFGGVLPGTVPDPGAEVDRLAKLGIRAIKMHPSHQVLSPNDYIDGNRGLAAVYERAQANGMPIMIN